MVSTHLPLTSEFQGLVIMIKSGSWSKPTKVLWFTVRNKTGWLVQRDIHLMPSPPQFHAAAIWSGPLAPAGWSPMMGISARNNLCEWTLFDAAKTLTNKYHFLWTVACVSASSIFYNPPAPHQREDQTVPSCPVAFEAAGVAGRVQGVATPKSCPVRDLKKHRTTQWKGTDEDRTFWWVKISINPRHFPNWDGQ